jgi:hypothetical protein
MPNQYYPNIPVPCFGAMPMMAVPNFDGEMRTFNPMTQMRQMMPKTNAVPQQQMTPAAFETAPGSPTVLDNQYTQGYLKSQIGKRVRITFLIGTNTIQDRAGTLTDVGISYIIINEADSNNPLLCDIYAIKFVLFLPD